MRKLLFHYDIVSPYSYFAFHVVRRHQSSWRAHGVDVDFKACFLGGLLKSTGNQSPISLPARAPYMMADFVRCGRYYDVPLQLPDGWPTNTLPAMRALAAMERDGLAGLDDVIAHLFDAHWGRGRWPADLDALTTLLTEAGVEQAADYVAQAQTPEVKTLLKAATEACAAYGAFGLPALVLLDDDGADPALYFGADRLPMLAFDATLPWHGPRSTSAPAATAE